MTGHRSRAGAARERAGLRLPVRRVLAVLAVLVGLLLVGAGLVALHGQEVSSTGGEQAEQLATARPAAGGELTVPVRSGRPAEAVDPQRPVALRIEALGVVAEVDEVGVDGETGQLALPAEGQRLGWYRFGPGLDAARGSVVIAGHVDTAGGPGALYRLGELEPGDTVVVTGADGEDRTFEVVAREVHPKAEIPLERYFARDGAFRLTLITCGGAFDRDSRQYRDNVVVTAVPTR